MVEDDIELYSDAFGYIEGLIKSRKHLENSPFLLDKLDDVIELELDLAYMAAEKARSALLKKHKNNLTVIKE